MCRLIEWPAQNTVIRKAGLSLLELKLQQTPTYKSEADIEANSTACR